MSHISSYLRFQAQRVFAGMRSAWLGAAPLLVAPLLVAVSSAGMMVLCAPAHAQTTLAQDMQMAADAGAYRKVADDFIAKSMAGHREAAQAMLSPNLVGRIGADGARQALQAQILPFFQRGKQLGRSTTVTRTTDGNGSTGFAFYLWLEQSAGGEALPFTVYVVEEQGQRVVANIVPNKLVPGRHQ